MESYGALAVYYDRLMSHIDYDAWATFAYSLLNLDPASRPLVLDLACGTGSMSVRLASRGLEVIGVDRSEEMLAAAESKAREWDVQVDFAQADLTSFELSGEADGAVCLFDSLNYLTSEGALRAALFHTARALRKGAPLVFDVHTEERLRQIGCETFGDVDRDLAYIWQSDYDEDTRICEMQVTLFVQDEASGLFRRYDEVHYERAHTALEIEAALAAAGFAIEAVYGADALDVEIFGEGREFYVARRT